MSRLRLAPPPEVTTAPHRPVCQTCGTPWPCDEDKARQRAAWFKHDLERCCWACGKPAKSAHSFGVLLPQGIVLSRWCGPAKHRDCIRVGMLYREADQRARTLCPVRTAEVDRG